MATLPNPAAVAGPEAFVNSTAAQFQHTVLPIWQVRAFATTSAQRRRPASNAEVFCRAYDVYSLDARRRRTQ